MREILLPTYLAKNKVWRDMCTGFDKLLVGVDEASARLRYIRYPYASFKSNVTTQSLQQQQSLTDGVASSVHAQDKQTLMKQVTFVGIPISDSNYVTAQQGLMLFRHASSYWYRKGVGENLTNFLNYALGLSGALSMEPLWTNDYTDFVEEGLLLESDKIQNGGAYYPTTHVGLTVTSAGGGINMPLPKFVQLFNDLSNYNLVLYKIDTTAIEARATMASSAVSADNPLDLPGCACNVIQELTWVF